MAKTLIRTYNGIKHYKDEWGTNFFEFKQGTLSASWRIEHNLDRFPTFTIIDTTGVLPGNIYPKIVHNNRNVTHIVFDEPFKGLATFI